ncbi:MAG TPA: transglycosylase SLT domain-containing protein [Acidimicrobiia bacterium]|nr:transglycosylase SLT domain-containing protein [Acidimicrobiia bacterium]
MGPDSSGNRWAATASVIVLAVALLTPVVARAQSEVDRAESAKNDADGLVVAAVADREAIEAELLATLERYQEFSTELASAAAQLDGLRERIARTGLEVLAATAAAGEKAAEAYMRALSLTGGVVWSTSSLEEALVAAPTLAMLAGEDDAVAADLAVTERDLKDLDERYRRELVEAEALTAGVEREAAHLQELFMLADQTVGLAIGQALAADTAYRQALDDVERARAAEEERQRQEDRTTTTSGPAGTTSPVTPTTAASGTSLSTTTTLAPTTTATTPGSISRVLKPAVERWRPLVSAHFMAALVDQALSVIQCESLGDPDAYNPYSGAAGLFQFLPGTWAVTSVKAGYSGASPFDPEANIASAAWLTNYYQQIGKDPWTPWHCQP